MLCEWSDGETKHVEIRNEDAPKRNVDECRQKDGEIRRNEVQHEDLLSQRRLIAIFRLVILIIGQPSGETGQDRGQGRHKRGEETGGQEYLEIGSDITFH